MAKTHAERPVLDASRVRKLYGSILDLGICVFGNNLNCKAVRGFARLDYLAIISGADVYDAYLNPGGTQRPLDHKRMEELFPYAVGMNGDKPLTGARAFPEVDVTPSGVGHPISE